MSEYWVSKKKYFCRYCEIYIADDVPSRQQHENGLRHKGNTERFIRNLYKTGEKRKKELDDEKRAMARVEQVRPFASDARCPDSLAPSGCTGRFCPGCRRRFGKVVVIQSHSPHRGFSKAPCQTGECLRQLFLASFTRIQRS
jgi:hypothetical protein